MAEMIRRKLDFTVEPTWQDQLWTHALREQEQSWQTQSALNQPTTRRMIMKIATPRIVIAALIGAGVVTAAAVGVSVQKYYFVEKRPEQGYIVRSEDGHSAMNVTEDHAASPEQAVATAEEIDLLRQQDRRELVGATEIEANGQLDIRGLSYKYTLADGHTITVGESDPESRTPPILTKEQRAEARPLLQQARVSGQKTPTFERVIQGRTFLFKKYEFTLSDGTQVGWSIGRLKDGQ
jgi:hypothetical protein